MTVSQGDIIKVDGNKALVLLNMNEGCGNCPSHDKCKQIGHAEIEVAVPSGWTLHTGDQVTLAFTDTPVAAAALLAYLLPIVCLLAGAGIGSWLDGFFGNASPAYAAVLAVVCFTLPLLFFRMFRGRIHNCGKQNAQLLEVLPQTSFTTN